jgi:hypothetical protein
MTMPASNLLPETRLRTARKICVNGVEVEQPENGQVNQQKRRRPLQAVAFQRPTNGGLSPSHSLGLKGVETTPKARRWSPSRPTPNSDHINGDFNSSFNGTLNGSTVQSTVREGEKALTAWDLPNLIRPLPIRRRPTAKRPRILSHYTAVVEFVYNNRFAIGSQVKKRFPAFLKNMRTTQYQLANLVQMGYLEKAPVRSLSPNCPFVYFATRKGIQLISTKYAELNIYWNSPSTEIVKIKGIALNSILHELFLTEFTTAMHASVARRGDLECLFTERRYFLRDKQLRYEEHGKIHQVIPDAGFLIACLSPEKKHDQNVKPAFLLHFVELDRSTMSLSRRIADKFEHYAKWAESETAQAYLAGLYKRYGGASNHPDFRLVVIAQSDYGQESEMRRLIGMFAQTLELPAKMRDRFWMATAADVHRHQADEMPLAENIWIRPRDARSWLADYRRVINAERLGSHQQAALARNYITERFTELPRHPLFPYGVNKHG